MSSYISNNLELTNESLLKIFAYIIDCDIADTLELQNLGLASISSIPELYSSLIYYYFKKMYNEKTLICSYLDYTNKELNYIAGDINVAESISRGSLGNGLVCQNVTQLSYNTEINNVIDYCLCICVNKFISKTKRYINDIINLYKTVFRHDFKNQPLKVEVILKNLHIIENYLNGDFSYSYKEYHNILTICKLFLESLYYSLENNDFKGITDDRLIQYIMENFSRTLVRRVMRRLAKEYNFVGKYHIWSDDLKIYKDDLYPDLVLDILIKFDKSVNLPDIIIDVKTNEFLTKGSKYEHSDNINQIYRYVNKYSKTKKKNVVGALLHYVSDKHKESAIKFNNTIIDTDPDIFMSVFTIEGVLDIKLVEFFVLNLLKRLLLLE